MCLREKRGRALFTARERVLLFDVFEDEDEDQGEVEDENENEMRAWVAGLATQSHQAQEEVDGRGTREKPREGCSHCSAST